MFEKLKEMYVRKKYGLCSKPVYVRIFDSYYLGTKDANGKFYYEHGDMDYICSEYAHNSVTYHYSVRGIIQHAHRFSEVTYTAIKHGSNFEVPEGYLCDYSEQELEMLNSVKKRGR